MKNVFIFSLCFIALAAFSFINPPTTLVGRWQKKIGKDVVVGAVFRSDSSYDGFVNGKSFVNGKYYVREDTLHISDGGCNSKYYGTYKVAVFVKDSIRFTVIQDTCRGRRRGSDGLTLGRVTQNKTEKP